MMETLAYVGGLALIVLAGTCIMGGAVVVAALSTIEWSDNNGKDKGNNS